VEGRSGDPGEVIRNRMRVYSEQTAPVAQHYADRGQLRDVDGMGGIDEINHRIVAALNSA